MDPVHVDRDRLAALAGYARDVIREALGGPRAVPPTGAWTREPGATFVTLRHGEALQGCVGSLEPDRAIVEDVARNAVAAAFHDRRGGPLVRADADRLTVEISVLSPAEPIAFTTERDALEALRPGHDGVLFAWHGRRATFLPQVWESLPDRVEFLARLKEKAGLDPRFWSPDVELSRYAVEKFIDPPSDGASA